MKIRRLRRSGIAMIATIAVVLATAGIAFAAVSTDQADYSPGSVVTISGDNSNGAGYLAGETVAVDVWGPSGYAATCEAVADDSGAWSCQVPLDADESAIGDYSYTAVGLTSGTMESGNFTDGPPPPPPPASLCNLASAPCPAATSLPTLNDTHYKVQVGTTITGMIIGATDASTALAPCDATDQVNVIIQSTPLGNTLVCGDLAGVDVTFTYTAPANGCQTSTVSYNKEGHHADNDIIVDGLDDNGTPLHPNLAGYAFVDSTGNVIPDFNGADLAGCGYGHIIVDKVTDPSGDPTGFNFTPSYGPNFSLTDAATPNDTAVVPGTYSVSEATVDGWDLTDASCSDGSPVTAIVVAPDETVRCTFTNKKAGTVHEAATSEVTTYLHLDGDDSTNRDGGSVPLGSTIHDKVIVSTGPATTIPAGSDLTVKFFTTGDCAGLSSDAPYDPSGDTSFTVDPANTQGPLHAGSYSYKAFFTSGDESSVGNGESLCETVTVDKGTVTLSTVIHREPNEADIGTVVVDGSTVHDHAIISGATAGFPVNVSFTFWTGGTACPTEPGGASAGGGASTTDVQSSSEGPLSSLAGGYAFRASVSGDPDYNDTVSPCEPLTVAQGALTKGYYGNKTGNAFLDKNRDGTIDAAPAAIGGAVRGVSVKNITCNNAILGADSSGFKALTTGGSSACTSPNIRYGSGNSTLATGVTQNQVSNLAAQNLALTYNVQYRTNFGILTLNGRGCAPATFGGFTFTTATVAQLKAALAGMSIDGNTTVTDLLAKANALLNNTTSVVGTATQTQVEAMTQLLGRCVNQEA